MKSSPESKPEALVILTPGFPGSEADSNWLPAHQSLVRALKNNFPEITVIVLSFFYPRDVLQYEWNGCRVISFNGASGGKGKHILFWRSVWQELKKIKKDNRVIGLFSFWCGETALLGHYFGKLHSVRHRCWVSGQDARKGNKWVKLIRPRPEELTAMSEALLRRFHDNYGIRPRSVIPNGIDTRLFPPLTPAERDIDIFGAGSLQPLKQYDLLVKVVASLGADLPGIRAMHCGGGEERQKLQSMIEGLGLEKNLALMGERPHAEILQMMQRTKVFLHTSSYEGYSTVCLEALYAGAHVISFCDPMDRQVPQWHIVRNMEEMAAVAWEILRNPHTEYKPVLVHSMDTIAGSVMQLFR